MDELASDLAIAKQYYEELIRLADLDSLANGEYGTGTKRQRIEDLLGKLVGLNRGIVEAFSSQPDDADAVPIIHLSSGLKDFYLNDLKPNSSKIRDICWDMIGLAEFKTLLDSSKPAPGERPIANAVSWGIDRWLSLLEEGELEEWHERGFYLEAASEFVNKGYFDPDSWLDNCLLLRPVLVDRPLNAIPLHVRFRLREIHRAFTYGLWMSAVALSRSVSEYAIIDNARQLGIESTYDRNGKPESKPFWLLAEEVSEVRPELREPLEEVRKAGNRIMHPKKKQGLEIISTPASRKEALGCVTQTGVIVENMYGPRN